MRSPLANHLSDKMGGTWSGTLEKSLLIHLLGLDTTVSRAQFQEVAEELGHGLSGESCR